MYATVCEPGCRDGAGAPARAPAAARPGRGGCWRRAPQARAPGPGALGRGLARVRPLGSRTRDRDLCSRAGRVRRLVDARPSGDLAVRLPPLVVARAGGRSGDPLRGRLGDGAAAGERIDLGDRRAAPGRRLGRLSAGPAGGVGRGAAGGLAGGADRAARRLAAVRRRRALRDPRDELQPRHVPASAGRRPARRRPLLGAAEPGLSAGAALDRRRSQQGAGRQPRPRLQRVDGGGLDPGAADRARRLRRGAAAAADRRRAGRRTRLRRRLLLRPGRLQGDDRGALRARLRPGAARDDPRLARAPAPLRPGSSPRGGRRLHLQLPGPALAAGYRGHLGDSGIRPGAIRFSPRVARRWGPPAARSDRPSREHRGGNRRDRIRRSPGQPRSPGPHRPQSQRRRPSPSPSSPCSSPPRSGG